MQLVVTAVPLTVSLIRVPGSSETLPTRHGLWKTKQNEHHTHIFLKHGKKEFISMVCGMGFGNIKKVDQHKRENQCYTHV